jgi:hypothetical protein
VVLGGPRTAKIKHQSQTGEVLSDVGQNESKIKKNNFTAGLDKVGGFIEALGTDVNNVTSKVTVLTLAEICDREGYHRPKLVRSMLNIGTELEAKAIENSEVFKRLVSGELVEAREIYGRPFVMGSTAKYLSLGNHLPQFKHATASCGGCCCSISTRSPRLLTWTSRIRSPPRRTESSS